MLTINTTLFKKQPTYTIHQKVKRRQELEIANNADHISILIVTICLFVILLTTQIITIISLQNIKIKFLDYLLDYFKIQNTTFRKISIYIYQNFFALVLLFYILKLICDRLIYHDKIIGDSYIKIFIFIILYLMVLVNIGKNFLIHKIDISKQQNADISKVQVDLLEQDIAKVDIKSKQYQKIIYILEIVTFVVQGLNIMLFILFFFLAAFVIVIIGSIIFLFYILIYYLVNRL